MEDEVSVAFIADVSGSRSVPDRDQLQRALAKAVRRASGILGVGDGGALISRMQITSGDEIQALFADAGGVVHAMRWLRYDLFPIGITFGIGRGAVDTEIDAENPGRIDGPCFHRARAALDEARGSGLVSTGFAGFGDADDVLSAGYLLIQAIERRWTERQRQFIMRRRRPFISMDAAPEQVLIAHEFQVSPSVVSESLKASNLAQVELMESALAALMRNMHKGGLLPAPVRGGRA